MDPQPSPAENPHARANRVILTADAFLHQVDEVRPLIEWLDAHADKAFEPASAEKRRALAALDSFIQSIPRPSCFPPRDPADSFSASVRGKYENIDLLVEWQAHASVLEAKAARMFELLAEFRAAADAWDNGRGLLDLLPLDRFDKALRQPGEVDYEALQVLIRGAAESAAREKERLQNTAPVDRNVVPRPTEAEGTAAGLETPAVPAPSTDDKVAKVLTLIFMDKDAKRTHDDIAAAVGWRRQMLYKHDKIKAALAARKRGGIVRRGRKEGGRIEAFDEAG